MSEPTFYYHHPIYGTYGINPPKKSPYEKSMVEHVQDMGSPKIKRNTYPGNMTREKWDTHPQKIQMDDVENREKRRSEKFGPQSPSPKGDYRRKQ